MRVFQKYLFCLILYYLFAACSHHSTERSLANSDVESKQKIRLLLTFDDGPSNEKDQSTKKILDVLLKQNIKAAFFVLTGPDQYGYHRNSILQPVSWIDDKKGTRGYNRLPTAYAKAETELGLELLKREAAEGHLVECHWGGTYQSQFKLHPNRLKIPAYDATGDGVIDRVTEPGNALESDLLQCMDRVKFAYTEVGMNYRPKFVRPPLWKYKIGALDARPTYEALGLKMILTDAKLFDGGYRWTGFVLDSWLISEAFEAIKKGKKDIVLTLHDSNPKTARDFGYVLAEIRRKFSNAGHKENVDWKFTDKTQEVQEILEGFVND
jgi:peptidoglycan/xylan/chitin deacetylase (PgdA/CDA1 family)